MAQSMVGSIFIAVVEKSPAQDRATPGHAQ
jgi:hypothetical protein